MSRRLAVLTVLGVLSMSAPAALAADALEYGRNVTLAEAKTAASAAEAEALKNGWAAVITVVEPNGQIVLSWKMDGASYAAPGVARRKAETAAGFKRPTKAFQDAVKAGNLNAISNGALAIEGGELLVTGGKIVGAIGVSGATPEQDGIIARAGAAAVK